MKIAVEGAGYVGLSLRCFYFIQHNDVITVDIMSDKQFQYWKSSIKDEKIEEFLKEVKTGKRKLSISATLNGKATNN